MLAGGAAADYTDAEAERFAAALRRLWERLDRGEVELSGPGRWRPRWPPSARSFDGVAVRPRADR